MMRMVTDQDLRCTFRAGTFTYTMKALPLLAAVLILVAPIFAEGTGSLENETRTLAPRKLSGSSRTTSSSETIQIADSQSANNAAWFAANQVARSIIEYTGLYLTVGGGYARTRVSDFSLTNSHNEILKTTKTSDGVGFVRAELCYQFDENWDLAFGYTRYGKGEVQIAFPKSYTFPLIEYYRHAMFYQTTRYSLMPTYSFEAGDKLRLRLGLGATCNQTQSHIDALYYATFSGVPSRLISESYPEQSRTDWSGSLSFGAEYEVFKHASLNLSLAYAPYRIKVPTSPGPLNSGLSQPSKGTVRVDTLEAALAFNFRR